MNEYKQFVFEHKKSNTQKLIIPDAYDCIDSSKESSIDKINIFLNESLKIIKEIFDKGIIKRLFPNDDIPFKPEQWKISFSKLTIRFYIVICTLSNGKIFAPTFCYSNPENVLYIEYFYARKPEGHKTLINNELNINFDGCNYYVINNGSLTKRANYDNFEDSFERIMNIS